MKEFVIFIQSTTASPISGKSKSYPSKKISRVTYQKKSGKSFNFFTVHVQQNEGSKIIGKFSFEKEKQLETREVVERGVKDADLDGTQRRCAIERENCAEGNSFPIILNLPKTDFLRLSLTPPFPSRRSPLFLLCATLS